MSLVVFCCLTTRILLTLVLFTFAFACSSKQNSPGTQTSSTSPILSSTPPFKTKEPNTYQATRSITFAPAGGGESVVSTVAIVKDGEMRREEDNSAKKTIVYLDLPSGSFVLLPDEKIYASAIDGGTTEDNNASDAPAEVYLHTAPIQSSYENLGNETVNGQHTSKYRVVVNNSGSGNVTESETLIWIDEALGMPIRSVMRSASGTRTMELSGINLGVDKRLFDIPKDYQKVEMRLLLERMR